MSNANSETTGPLPPTQKAPQSNSPTDPAWRAFCDKHKAWLALFPHTNPLYRLHWSAIGSLNKSGVLDDQANQAEHDLWQLCEHFCAVGFLNGAPISYPLLSSSPPRAFSSTTRRLVQPPAEQRPHLLPAKTALERFLRPKGYVGWLLTEPAFRDATRSLEQRWLAVPDQSRAHFPLLLGSSLPKSRAMHKPPIENEASEDFYAEFVTFCDRWALTGMASWELPEPQLPLFHSPIFKELPRVPSNVLHIIVPVYYQVLGSDNWFLEVSRCQKEMAVQAGIDASAASQHHFKFYSRLLEVIHLENVIISRYGPVKEVPGLVGHIKKAIRRVCKAKPGQVDKWRKAISACRRGRRASVPTLKSRS